MVKSLFIAIGLIIAIVLIVAAIYFLTMQKPSTPGNPVSTIASGYNASGYNQSGYNTSGYNQSGRNSSVPKTSPNPT